jgi:hypothetical protein
VDSGDHGGDAVLGAVTRGDHRKPVARRHAGGGRDRPVHGDVEWTGRRRADHLRVVQQRGRGPTVPGGARILHRHHVTVPVEYGGGEAEVADRGGDAGQPGQPADQVTRYPRAFRQRDRKIPFRPERLACRNDDVGPGEPADGCV